MSATCIQCGAPLTHVQGKRPKQYCSNACTLRASRARGKADREALEYAAKNILAGQDLQESMPWLKAIQLSAKYPQWPQEFILRGVLASEYSNVPLEYFEKRYLQEDKSVPQNPAFTSAYQDLLLQARADQWSAK